MAGLTSCLNCLHQCQLLYKLEYMLANPGIRKQGLHDALVQAKDDVIAVLEPYVRSGTVPKEPITEACPRPQGGYVYRHYHRRDYTALATAHTREWANLPSVQKAIQELFNDADVQQDFKTVGFGNPHDYVTNQIVHQFIYRILHLTRRWPPSKSVAETLFYEFEDYLLGTTVSCEAMIPLQNLEYESRKLILGQDMEIHELSEPEKEKIVSRAISGSLENEMEAMRHRYAAIIKLSWRKGDTPPDYREKVGELLTALRLFKTGGVGANTVYRREPRWQPGHIVGGTGRNIYFVPVVGPVYKLNSREAKDFVKFWKWLYQEPLNNNAEVAIRWFNHGYEDWIPEDRVVSFVTALESLFLKKDERKEKNLGSRIPKLLTNAAKRKQLKDNVVAMWKLRSNVVHAMPYQADDVPRLADIAERYLRDATKRYIELERKLKQNAHADILSWLDSPGVDRDKQKMFPHWQAI